MGKKRKHKDMLFNTPRGVGGVYRFCETFGVPLEIVMIKLNEKKRGTVAWLDYFLDSKKAGRKYKSIMQTIRSALLDVYGQEGLVGFENFESYCFACDLNLRKTEI